MTLRRAGRSGVLASAALAFALGAAPSTARPAAADLWLALQVKLDLVRAERLDALAIHVDAADGLVTLRGFAGHDEGKARAESIARGVGGMRPVRNLIRVVPDADALAFAQGAPSAASEGVE
jgi:osmotically-inducible protein OsmY